MEAEASRAMSDPKWMEKLREHKRHSEDCGCIENVIQRVEVAEERAARLQAERDEARELYDVAVKQNVEKLQAGITKRWLDEALRSGQLADCLRELIANPWGCAFCDSGGILRKRVDGAPPFHMDDCLYLKAARLIEEVTPR